ncbi:MAG: MmgE/PrpD family protein [Rubrivivax sp.]
MSAAPADAGLPLARQLARFVVGTPADTIDALAIERAAMSLASTVASAAMGHGIASARLVRELELHDGGRPDAGVWFTDARLPQARAARVNALASDAAASDDSDLRSIAHIGTIVSTVGLAVGQALGAGGRELLAAMVLGYEVAGRIDEALTPGRMQRGFHGSVSTVFGAAVAAGRLMGLDETRLAQAIAIAATSIGGMAIAADTSCAREYHAGMAAMAGLQAAQAAARGFEAEPAVLERPRGFLAAMGAQAVDDITRGLGDSWDIVTDMAIKLMPGAHPFHATAEAAADAARQGAVRPADVERITISAAVQHTHFKGDPHPRNLVDAAHSLHYFVAAAIADGGFDWPHMDEVRMADPVIAALQDRVHFDPHPPPLPDRFPHRHGGSVTIRLHDGRTFSATCRSPRGSGPRGVEWADVQAKCFRLLPRAGVGPARARACLEAIRALPQAADLHALLPLLRAPDPSDPPAEDTRA